MQQTKRAARRSLSVGVARGFPYLVRAYRQECVELLEACGPIEQRGGVVLGLQLAGADRCHGGNR